MNLNYKPEQFTLRFSELNLPKDDIKRAIGYSEDKEYPMVDEYIDELFEIGNDICDIKGGYLISDSLSWDTDNYFLNISSVTLEIGKVIFNQIKKSSSTALFLCTAGNKIYEESRKIMNEGDFLRGYVYDTFGSLVVETAMDIIQDNLKSQLISSGCKITNRYSPGYCGWNVSEQKKIFSLLPENFCDVKLTDTCLMVPIKSVSGIIGIGESVKYNSYTCNICDSTNCLYRNLRHKEN